MIQGFLFSSLFLCALAATPKGCENGCTGSRVPVCGADERTYYSACVAECQGINVAKQGPCTVLNNNQIQPTVQSTLFEDRPLGFTMEEMQQFKSEGFDLLGAVKIAPFDPELGATRTGKVKKSSRPIPAGSPLLTTLRTTPDGLLYGGAPPPATLAVNAAQQLPAGPIDETKSNAAERKLLAVLGTDTRQQVFAATGQLLFTQGNTQYMCSGAMISEKTALTAAHCVFDRNAKIFAGSMTFSPGQVSASVKPFGSVNVKSYSYFLGWTDTTNSNYWPFDMAALRLEDAKLGYRTGYFGLQQAINMQAVTLQTAGYPGDKASGSLWWTSCVVTDTNIADGQVYHTCDTYGGQSGSPVYNSNNLIVAVHSWSTASQNGAAQLSASTYPAVVGWR